MDNLDVQAKYRDALDSFLTKARADQYIVAVVLLGSLSYDTVWERSDIDIYLITQDIKLRVKGYCLVENDININAMVATRADFKRAAESAFGGSFMHSLFSRGTLVYSEDKTIDEFFAERHKIGARDREISMLRAISGLIPAIDKAHKWLRVKNDPDYCFLWIMKCLDSLATLDLIRRDEIPDREAILHATRINPDLFVPLYSGLINSPKDASILGAAVDTIEAYIVSDAHELASPIFDFLAETDGVRSYTEVTDHFTKNMGVEAAGYVCGWLADRELIDKVSAPVRITEKSRVPFDEAAFYYDRT